MKLVKGSLFILLSALALLPIAHAQSGQQGNAIDHDVMFFSTQAPGGPPAPSISVFDIKVVKGAPYSATAESETTQTLPDGNRIVQRNNTKIYRDNEGRTRQELDLGSPGAGGKEGLRIVSISDPVGGFSYTLHPEIKVAEKLQFMNPGSGIFNMPVAPDGEISKDANVFVRKEILAGSDAGGVPTEISRGIRVFVQKANNLESQKSEEALGTQVMEGVEVTGKRVATTIPAGQIGNERAITVSSESWYSADLQTIVYSKRDDPTSGVTIYRLTNLTRGEPDAALFRIPPDYTVNEPKTQKIILDVDVKKTK